MPWETLNSVGFLPPRDHYLWLNLDENTFRLFSQSEPQLLAMGILPRINPSSASALIETCANSGDEISEVFIRNSRILLFRTYVALGIRAHSPRIDSHLDCIAMAGVSDTYGGLRSAWKKGYSHSIVSLINRLPDPSLRAS